jgi:hypothetical protein
MSATITGVRGCQSCYLASGETVADHVHCAAIGCSTKIDLADPQYDETGASGTVDATVIDEEVFCYEHDGSLPSVEIVPIVAALEQKIKDLRTLIEIGKTQLANELIAAGKTRLPHPDYSVVLDNGYEYVKTLAIADVEDTYVRVPRVRPSVRITRKEAK